MNTLYLMPAGTHGSGPEARAADRAVLTELRRLFGARPDVKLAFQVAVPHRDPAYYARSKLAYFVIRSRIKQAMARASFFGKMVPLLSANIEEYNLLPPMDQPEARRLWWATHTAAVRRMSSAIKVATGQRALTNFEWSMKLYPDTDTLLELGPYLHAFGPNCYQARDTWTWYTPIREAELGQALGKRVACFVNGKSKISRKDGSVVDVPEVHLNRQASELKALGCDFIVWCEINRPGAVEAAARCVGAFS